MHFAAYYRWVVATRYWSLPRRFEEAVLDIGANDGYFLSQVQAPRKIGVDIAPARATYIPLIQADAQKLPFPAEAFGHVFAFDIIEHVVDDRALLADVVRVLAPDGVLWLSTTAQKFTIFPGGALQERLHQGWGHVRRGYTGDGLISRLPDEKTEITLFLWDESFFRAFYLPLKALFGAVPGLVLRIIPWIAAVDAHHREGESGHLFARIVKCDRSPSR
jgi:SAM-dependent methyltransferase